MDQRAISRNASADVQEPVFIVERDGVQTRVHGLTLTNARLRYDRTANPRAWLEADAAEPD